MLEDPEGCHLWTVHGKPKTEARPLQGLRGEVQVGCQQALPTRGQFHPICLLGDTTYVLCSCKPYSRAWQLCHNAIQDHLVKAILLTVENIAVNSDIPGMDSQLQLDSVITKKEQKKILMVDTTVPFQNRTPATPTLKLKKVEKYVPLANAFRTRSYEVQTHTDYWSPGCMGS
ncbi:hypothetical protein KIL84_011018 [Mauremys mutica]|uniref:Uncharacterized protein n=1 Tax=Mauremys mutica TaxID=74926 RepID=A0A9D4B1Y3_9SAUR|nr:hypothetical protein KIL84_011018 [Mauremys mutica]